MKEEKKQKETIKLYRAIKYDEDGEQKRYGVLRNDADFNSNFKIYEVSDYVNPRNFKIVSRNPIGRYDHKTGKVILYKYKVPSSSSSEESVEIPSSSSSGELLEFPSSSSSEELLLIPSSSSSGELLEFPSGSSSKEISSDEEENLKKTMTLKKKLIEIN